MIIFASLGYLVSVFVGWWIVPLWAFALGLFVPKGLKGLWQVCLSVFLVWLIFAYFRDGQSLGLISTRLAEMFQVPRAVIFFLTGLLGAILAAPAYLIGANIKNLSR